MVRAKQRQVRSERFKLIYIPLPIGEGARFELYDLTSDPDNRSDLSGIEAYAETRDALKRLLFDWMLEEPGSGLDSRLHLIRRYNFFE
ncbi:MAG: hypothetical protein KJ645_01360 [Planctomycetes bacterium]|nr:hypothetical protein [Planctomycetota bacterium]